MTHPAARPSPQSDSPGRAALSPSTQSRAAGNLPALHRELESLMAAGFADSGPGLHARARARVVRKRALRVAIAEAQS